MSDTVQATPPAEPPGQTLELRRYQEDLAKEYGLPSPFQTGLLKQMCRDMVDSGMAPAHFNNNPMALYLAAMRGRELGLDPYESILETFWAMEQYKWNPETRQRESRGVTLGIYANKMLDLLHRRNITSEFLSETKEKCEILFIPPKESGHKLYTAVFMYQEAAEAGLIRTDDQGHVKKDSNWVKWPKAMLKARAISLGWRAMGGVGGKGANLYSKEELEDMREYETVGGEGTPTEVQAEKPATAGRKLKEKPAQTITVKPEEVPRTVVAPEPAPVAEPAPEPKPELVNPGATFYVISSAATLPELDKVEEEPIRRFKLATEAHANIADAMRGSDALTKGGTTHYVLTFEGGKAKLLHTSKVVTEPAPVAPAPKVERMYLVLSLADAAAANSPADILAAAIAKPHSNATACELMAQAEANKTGKSFVAVYEEAGKWKSLVQCDPPKRVDEPVAATPAPTPAPVEVKAEPAQPTAEDQVVRERIRDKYKSCIANVPIAVKLKDRKPLVESYLMAYLAIDDMKSFSQNLALAEASVDSCLKDLAGACDFSAKAPLLGKAARQETQLAPLIPEPPEVPAMKKYYADRGWVGSTTSLAEAWRRKNNMDPDAFAQNLKFSGIDQVHDKDAAAYFSVGNQYGGKTAADFGVNVDPANYAETLRKLRDRFDGAELSAIPAVKFMEALTRLVSDTGDDAPLFQ